MKQYTTFLFDFDGTLLDSSDHVIGCFQDTFKEVMGYELPTSTITATFGIPLAEALQDLAPEHAEELLTVYRKYSDAIGFSKLREIDGAKETLKALHEMGCVNAIVTSKKEVNAQAQMDYIGITPYIDCLVGPDQTTAHKPDPEPVYCALRMLHAKAEDAIMIGDSPFDILCGKNAHVDTAGVDFTTVDLDSLKASEPTYMLSHLSELIALAKKA